MIGKTHLAGGLAAAAVICQAVNLPLAEGLIFTTGCAVGSLFPDIDHESSTVGKRVKPLSSLLHKTVGHRTLFHWFVPYCLLAVVLHLWKPSWDVVTMAVLIGVLTHLFLDALNPSGVPVFPGLKLNLLKIKTESGFDKAIGTLLALVAVAISCTKALSPMMGRGLAFCCLNGFPPACISWTSCPMRMFLRQGGMSYDGDSGCS